MSKGKVLFALGIFLGVLAGGWFLSNYLVLLLLDLRGAPLTWNTWWQYLQAANLPQYAPYAAKIKLSGAIGFGVPLLGWFALLTVPPGVHRTPCMSRR